MHYHVEVWIPEKLEGAKLEAALEHIMAPFSEHTNPSGWWDWYQIGARWMNAHNPNYKPEEDPRNHETCLMCRGTGMRTDDVGEEARKDDPTFTCNGCTTYDFETKKRALAVPGKPGMAVKWPTAWVVADDTVMSAKDIPDEFSCYYLVVAEEGKEPQAFLTEYWDPEEKDFKAGGFDGKVKAQLKKLGLDDKGYLVTVDCHC